MSLIQVKSGFAIVAVVAAIAIHRSRESGLNAAVADQDPCTLLSASDVMPYLGSLPIAPYRADDPSGRANVHGEECMYRGRDGRQITVLASWEGARGIGNMLQDLPSALGRAGGQGRGNSAGAGLDSMSNKVL